ncbi:S8 family serine peptidase [Plantactinospora sp. B6F1]|uniref:S8 family serine peptidase n=1 Tax=Plantactinospora sp. B6F1 TaxID=3158971 RepID=UPI0032D8F2A7
MVLGLALVATALAPTGTSAAAAPSAEPAGPAGKIAASLRSTFEKSAGDRQDFWISFGSRADTSGARDIADWAERGAYVVDHLKKAATAAQADTIKTLKAAGVDYEAFWVSNAIRINDGDYGLAQVLAARPEVKTVFAPVTYEQPEPIDERVSSSRLGLNEVATAEWGVLNIKADEVWQQYGVRGDGIVVANVDTGVQFDHPALIRSYRGYDADKGTIDNDYNWFDPATGTPFPTDDNGHGTHTIGTMVGDDGAANQVGVAPGARWIAARGCEARTCSDVSLLAASQWMLAPTRIDGSGADPAKRPHIVNNSWGSENPSNDPLMEDVQRAWADAAIFAVWSNGNSGPGCNTSATPGSRTINYSTGAYDSNNKIASFSSRGSGQDGEIKPNISAPGVDVRSAWPGNEYWAISGTSMAAPHVSGSVALLWSAEPELRGDIDATRRLLDDTATDTPDTQCGGTDDDNNVYGEGRLDALKMVKAGNPAPTGTITGTITNADTGTAVPSARIQLVNGDLGRSARTGADGTYTANIAAGDYQATVSAFGFKTTTVPISVIAGQTTTTDIALPTADGFTVSGKVVDQRTGKGIPDANVTLAGSLFAGVTAADGSFTVPKVPGPARYQLTVDAGACTRTTHRSVMVEGDTTVPTVEMTRVPDQPDADGFGAPYGYTCVAEPATWVGGTTPVTLPPADSYGLLDLPFEFTYFGEQYRRLGVSADHAHVTFRPEQNTVSWGSAMVQPYGWPFFRGRDEAILTRTAGTAPNRTFTVEWRDFWLAGFGEPVDQMSVAMTLHENGDIVFAYKDIDPDRPRERGLASTVDITDHSPDGRAVFRTHLLATNLDPVLSDTKQFRFELPPNGLVAGRVLDKTTRKPVPGAAVDLLNSSGGRLVRKTTDDNGEYRLQLMTGRKYSVAVHKTPGYEVPDPVDVTLTTDRQVMPLTTTLHGGGMALSASGVTITPKRPVTVTLTNSGDRQLTWRATTHSAEPTPAPGSLLASVSTKPAEPIGMVAVDGRSWVSTLGVRNTLVELQDGHPTGAEIDLAPLAASYNMTVPEVILWGNMAWIPSRHWLCVFPSYIRPESIACVDPTTSQVKAKIPTGIGPGNQIIGMAYDPERDLFFVNSSSGGLGSRMRTIAGIDHPEPGAVQRTCALPYSANGLGYNVASRMSSSYLHQRTGNVVRQFDPETCGTISQFPAGYWIPGAVNSGGLDARGNLLFAHWGAGTTSTMQTDDPSSQAFPWLHVSTTSGSLKPRKKEKIQISVDWAAVPADVTSVRLVLRGNGGANTAVTLPITLRR